MLWYVIEHRELEGRSARVTTYIKVRYVLATGREGKEFMVV